jgi:hypothetical protein
MKKFLNKRTCYSSRRLANPDTASELGCNFIQTAHYPQNEHVVRLAEKWIYDVGRMQLPGVLVIQSCGENGSHAYK